MTIQEIVRECTRARDNINTVITQFDADALEEVEGDEILHKLTKARNELKEVVDRLVKK